MAFSSTNSPQLMLDGLGMFASTQGGSVLPRVWFYGSTHLVADITATGFFAACGYGSRSGAQVGMRVGDLLINRSSTDASAVGRTTMHSVVGSTANVTSTTASTGWSAAYDITVSST